MTRVYDIEQFLYDWAPRELAADWDNVGHLIGDPEQEVKRILVSLDTTDWVVDEAIACNADLIVSHHPVMNCAWNPVQSLRLDDRQGRVLSKILHNGISVICMHTNLDVANGGVNDVLASRLGLTDIQPLSKEKIGRIGKLKYELPLDTFLSFVVESLKCHGVRYRSGSKPVCLVAVGGGSCGDYISDAIALGCDTFVTADLKYNHFLDTEGLNLIDAGHFPTENVICPVIVDRLSSAFSAVEIIQSTSHQEEIIQYCTKEK